MLCKGREEIILHVDVHEAHECPMLARCEANDYTVYTLQSLYKLKNAI